MTLFYYILLYIGIGTLINIILVMVSTNYNNKLNKGNFHVIVSIFTAILFYPVFLCSYAYKALKKLQLHHVCTIIPKLKSFLINFKQTFINLL